MRRRTGGRRSGITVGGLCAVLAIVQAGGFAEKARAYIVTLDVGVARSPASDPRFFYGICWQGEPAENLAFAKAMGYQAVFYQDGMEAENGARDIGFIIEGPQSFISREAFGSVYVDPGKKYSAEEREFIERHYAWKSLEPFPGNLAAGWYPRPGSFAPLPDVQQEAVVELMVEKILERIKALERPERGFTFKGLAWDVPQLTGDFWSGYMNTGGRQVTLARWTGADAALLHPGITHEYATYSDGMAAFYKRIKARVREAYPDAAFIVEPYRPYEDWYAHALPRSDAAAILADFFVTQEKGGLEFLEDDRLRAAPGFSPAWTGSTTPDLHDFARNARIAAEAMRAGAWFNWYGRLGGSGDGKNYHSVAAAPAWITLLRAMTGWENLNGVPLGERGGERQGYRSPLSGITEGALWSRHPVNGKLYVVFRDRSGRVPLPAGATVASARRADALWRETAYDAARELAIGDDGVRMK